MSIFDYIGRHENRPAALEAISDLCERPLTDTHLDAAPKVGPDLDGAERLALTDMLKDDIRFYERWALRART